MDEEKLRDAIAHLIDSEEVFYLSSRDSLKLACKRYMQARVFLRLCYEYQAEGCVWSNSMRECKKRKNELLVRLDSVYFKLMGKPHKNVMTHIMRATSPSYSQRGEML